MFDFEIGQSFGSKGSPMIVLQCLAAKQSEHEHLPSRLKNILKDSEPVGIKLLARRGKSIKRGTDNLERRLVSPESRVPSALRASMQTEFEPSFGHVL